MTKLVVFTGFPATGKTTLAKKLMNEEGFARLSTDDLRNQLYEKNYGQLKDENLGKEKEEAVRDIMGLSKNKLLKRGVNVVIDSSAPNKKLRNKFLYTNVKNIDNYLVHIYSDIEILKNRQKERGKEESIIEDFLNEYWEKLDENINATIIKIENNPPITLDELYFQLKGRIF